MASDISKVKVRASVSLTLLVDVSDVWDGDCPVSQVHHQAIRSALDIMNSALAEHARRLTFDPSATRVISTIVESE